MEYFCCLKGWENSNCENATYYKLKSWRINSHSSQVATQWDKTPVFFYRLKVFTISNLKQKLLLKISELDNISLISRKLFGNRSHNMSNPSQSQYLSSSSITIWANWERIKLINNTPMTQVVIIVYITAWCLKPLIIDQIYKF